MTNSKSNNRPAVGDYGYNYWNNNYPIQTDYNGTITTNAPSTSGYNGNQWGPDAAKNHSITGVTQYSINVPAPWGTTKTNPWLNQFSILDNGDVLWNNNPTEVPIIFFGDKVGNPVLEGAGNESIKAESPMALSTFKTKILNDYSKKPGGILELKNLLASKGAISSRDAAMSLKTGDNIDQVLINGITIAASEGSRANWILSQQGSKKFISFEDYLKDPSKIPDYSGAQGGSGIPSRTVSISRTKFRPEDFDIAIDQLFQATLGRGATKDELNGFVKQMQSYENKHPQKTVTIRHGNTQTSTTSGGVNADYAQSKMREQALASPEAEGYNKATKYLDYFTQALNAPIKLV